MHVMYIYVYVGDMFIYCHTPLNSATSLVFANISGKICGKTIKPKTENRKLKTKPNQTNWKE